MKVEKVKWKWAETVQRKEVYRDDEFIRTTTKEEALKAVDFFMSKGQGGYLYTITVLREGEYFTYLRSPMPCYGGLVKYKDSHGDRYWMNPYFPRDIYVAYPEGDTVLIAVHRSGLAAAMQTPYMQFIFSPESPWVSAFGKKESVIFQDNYFVLTDMNTDPTVLYSMIRLGGLASYNAATTFSPKAETLATKATAADPRRLAGQKPVRTSGGTWAEGYGYTRPYNESIFKTSLPTKFADFGTLPTTGYPPAFNFDATYFNTTMKDVFKVDVSNFRTTLKLTPEQDAALVKAWDYFKEKAAELDE